MPAQGLDAVQVQRLDQPALGDRRGSGRAPGHRGACVRAAPARRRGRVVPRDLQRSEDRDAHGATIGRGRASADRGGRDRNRTATVEGRGRHRPHRRRTRSPSRPGSMPGVVVPRIAGCVPPSALRDRSPSGTTPAPSRTCTAPFVAVRQPSQPDHNRVAPGLNRCPLHWSRSGTSRPNHLEVPVMTTNRSHSIRVAATTLAATTVLTLLGTSTAAAEPPPPSSTPAPNCWPRLRRGRAGSPPAPATSPTPTTAT